MNHGGTNRANPSDTSVMKGLVLAALSEMDHVRAESATASILAMGLGGTALDEELVQEAFFHLKFVSQLPEHLRAQIPNR
jgi:hypothetical protein